MLFILIESPLRDFLFMKMLGNFLECVGLCRFYISAFVVDGMFSDEKKTKNSVFE